MDIKDLSDDDLRAHYLRSMPDDELQSHLDAHDKSGWLDSAKDYLKGVYTGAVHEAPASMSGMAHGGQTLENIFRQRLGIPPKEVTAPTEEQARAATDTSLGLPQPQSGYGQAGLRTGEFLGNPASYVGPGGPVGKAIGAGLAGTGSYLGEKGVEAYLPGWGAAGSLGGALAGGMMAPTTGVGRYADDVAKVAGEIGPKNLTAGDVTGNKTIRAFESELSPARNEKQDQAIKSSQFAKVGEDIGDRPIIGKGGAVDTMLDRTGKKFDDLQARNSAEIDQKAIADLKNIHDNYHNIPGLYGDDVKNAVNGSINRILDVSKYNGLAGTGKFVSGEEYQKLRSSISRAARGAPDPQKAEALHDITHTLDDAMERTIAKTNPQDAGEWSKARRDYTNALVLERWAQNGEDKMTPNSLANAAKTVYGKRQYMRGRDDFSDFAEPARRVLTQFPDSGTARRTVAEKSASQIGSALGGAALGGATGAGTGFVTTPEGENVAPFLLGEGLLGAALGRPALRFGLMNPGTQAALKNVFTMDKSEAAMRLARALGQTNMPANLAGQQ